MDHDESSWLSTDCHQQRQDQSSIVDCLWCMSDDLRWPSINQNWFQIAIRSTYPPVSSNTESLNIPELNGHVWWRIISIKWEFPASHVWLPQRVRWANYLVVFSELVIWNPRILLRKGLSLWGACSVPTIPNQPKPPVNHVRACPWEIVSACQIMMLLDVACWGWVEPSLSAQESVCVYTSVYT